jgi:hypothetical protein
MYIILAQISCLNRNVLARSQYSSGRSCHRSSHHRIPLFSSRQMLRFAPSSKSLLCASRAASSPGLKSIKIKPLSCQNHQIIFPQIIQFDINLEKLKFCGPCLKPPLLQASGDYPVMKTFTFTVIKRAVFVVQTVLLYDTLFFLSVSCPSKESVQVRGFLWILVTS